VTENNKTKIESGEVLFLRSAARVMTRLQKKF